MCVGVRLCVRTVAMGKQGGVRAEGRLVSSSVVSLTQAPDDILWRACTERGGGKRQRQTETHTERDTHRRRERHTHRVIRFPPEIRKISFAERASVVCGRVPAPMCAGVGWGVLSHAFMRSCVRSANGRENI